MENIGKERYRNLPLPPNLEQTVSRAVRRGMLFRAVKRFASSAAAVLAVMILCANIPVLYAGAAELPILGQMVRVLRIGSGGQAAADVYAAVCTSGDSIQLAFTAADGTAASVPLYSAARKTAPFRVVLRLHGIADMDTDALLDALKDRDAVADAYLNAYSQDTERGVTILLKEGYDCSIGEYRDPNVLSIAFFREEALVSEPVYYLRTESIPFGTELAARTEQLAWEGATQVRTSSGQYCVVLGSYRTEEQARRAQAGLEKHFGGALGLHVAHGDAYQIPAE